VRDPAGHELVQRAARAAALSARLGLLAAAVLVAGCGGGGNGGGGGPAKSHLAWDGTPVVRASSTGARVLIGKVENRSSGELRLEVPQLKVVDRHGRRVRSTAVFASSFVRSMFAHNGVVPVRPERYPEAERRRVGFLAVLGAGETAPLTVSWLEQGGHRASRIVLGPASLAVPQAAVNDGAAPPP
jgi:hypothetical protein